ncbi:hypothetical protein Tco_1274911 [Tanacetum coccineum]
MSNTNTNLQTQTSNALHNAIMEAGGKDRPPMLAPCNYHATLTNSNGLIKLSIAEGSSETLTEGRANDFNSTVVACQISEMWKAIERNRGKAIVNSFTPTYDQESTMVAKDDEISKDKEIDKLMALISLSFKKIYKPTNNNLKTSSNTSRQNHDNTPRINRGTGYDNQRVVNIVRARENVARKCQKSKRAKDTTYHKEKMILCKQEEAGFQLNAEQADWRDDIDDEPEN